MSTAAAKAATMGRRMSGRCTGECLPSGASAGQEVMAAGVALHASSAQASCGTVSQAAWKVRRSTWLSARHQQYVWCVACGCVAGRWETCLACPRCTTRAGRGTSTSWCALFLQSKNKRYYSKKGYYIKAKNYLLVFCASGAPVRTDSAVAQRKGWLQPCKQPVGR